MTALPEHSAVRQRLQVVLENIGRAAARVGREPHAVRLIVVTKGVPVERVQEAVEAGARDIGENRLQEALPKVEVLAHDWNGITWHFIGRLQRRKVKGVVGAFSLIHSVDSLALAEEIERRARSSGIRQRVLLEVNLGDEPSKGGFSPSRIAEALSAIDRMASLQVEGLMAIPPYSPHPEEARPHFRRLRELGQSLRTSAYEHVRLEELSMGMSQDYEIAVEEGATMVRVGTAIFGARG